VAWSRSIGLARVGVNWSVKSCEDNFGWNISREIWLPPRSHSNTTGFHGQHSRDYNSCRQPMSHFLKSIIPWIVDVLPEISDLILVLVGVFLSLPKLAERIENQKVARYSTAIVCILLGLCGFVIRVNQRHQFNSTIAQLVVDDDKLVTNTSNLVGATNTMVTDFGVLMPQVTVLTARIHDLGVKIAAAKESHNPRLVQELQAKQDATQRQADSVAKKLLVSIVSNLINSLERSIEDWRADKDNRYKFYWERRQHARWDRKSTQEMEKIERDWEQEQAQIDARHASEIKDAVQNANYLREQVLQMLPETDEDKAASVLFSELLKGDIGQAGIEQAILYLRNLVSRIEPTKQALPSAPIHH